MAGIKEYSLSIDEFNNPKVYEGAPALMLLLTRIILLEPGLFQSHPDMGVGLLTEYRFRTDNGGLAAELKSRITTQIDKYLPFLTGAEVAVSVQENSYYISITINGIIYGIFYDAEHNTIQTDFKAVSDL